MEEVPTWAVVGTLLLALLLRLYVAAATTFNPDEAMHVVWADAAPLSELLEFIRRIQHPPLFLLILRPLTTIFGRSEFWLRLPFVLLNVFACGCVYLWVRRLATPRAALAALFFAAASPVMVNGAIELRQGGLALAGCVLALWVLEEALQQARRLTWVILLLATFVASMSHYSTGLLVPVVLVYCLVRRAPTARAVWLGGLIVAIAGGAVLYTSGTSLYWHLRTMGRAPSYLQPHLYSGAPGDLVPFINRALQGTWSELAGIPALATPLSCVGVIGWAAAASGASRLLLLGPFIVALLVALLGLYPMGDTRHVAYLLPFAAASVGIGVATITRPLGNLALVAVGLGCLFWPYFAPADNLRNQVFARHRDEAWDFVRQTFPPDVTLVLDEQTMYVLLAKMGRPDQLPEVIVQRFRWMDIEGRPALVHRKRWCFAAQEMDEVLRESIDQIPSESNARGWVLLSSGWELAPPLMTGVAPARMTRYRSFGPFRALTVGPGA